MDSRLQNMPIAFFSTVMGLSGLAIALQRAGELWAFSTALGNVMTVTSLLVFVLLALLYAMKAFRHPARVGGELSDPVKMSFGATVTVSLVLLSVATPLMHSLTGLPVYVFLAWLFLAILFAVVAYLAARTLYAIARQQICVEGH